MKFKEGRSIESCNKDKSRPQFHTAALVVSIASALVIGFITAPSLISAQTTTTPVPGIIASNTTTGTTNTNTTAAASNATATTTKPIDGYNTPQGHLSAIRHVFDDPALRVQHYCKPNDKIVLVCQLYDSSSKNATLIGIEYVITSEQYKSLPNREKPNWHLHKIEFAPNRADPMFPELPAAKAKALMGNLMDTYGKVIITWNPKDKLPAFPPQAEQVQHPFMVNATAVPNIHAGSFNQTLKY
jgi:hypothetical protein